MSQRPLEALKKSAEELAALIFTDDADKSRIDSLMQELNVCSAQLPEVASISRPPQKKIGIWVQSSEDENEYLRSDRYADEWHAWADVDSIPKKRGDKKRIVFLGESVARGFFYDPLFSPAKALDAILAHYDLFEIIDLARLGMELKPLKNLCRSALDLEPDMIVCSAGNNWGAALFQSLDERELSVLESLLNENDSPAVKGMLEKKIKELIADFVGFLKEISVDHNIPVVYVIPEFNLQDWKSSYLERATPWIKGGGTAEWINARRNAEMYLKKGAIDLAENWAIRMQELDGARHPSSFELLSQCKIKKGALEDGRKLLEDARDTSLFGRLRSKSRRFTATHDGLMEQLALHQIHFLDVKSIFKESLQGGIPDRRLFLDYCHMSAEGIQVVMQHLAHSILQTLSGRDIPLSDVMTRSTQIDDDVNGQAHFFAAIHNAEHCQSYDLILHHCKCAVASSPQTTQLLVDYLDFSLRRASNMFCQSHQDFIDAIKSSNPSMRLFYKATSLDLIRAMTSALESVGVNAANDVDSLMKDEHGVKNNRVNLLETCYQLRSSEESYGSKKAYFQSQDIHSDFLLVAAKKEAMMLDITCRLPRGSYENSDVHIKLNGNLVERINGKIEWQRSEIILSAEMINEGINILTIEWPAAAELDLGGFGLFERLFPSYGEIHSLVISS